MKLGELLSAVFKLIFVVIVASIILIYSGFANALLAKIDSAMYGAISNATRSMGVGEPPVSSVVRAFIYRFYPIVLIVTIAVVVAAGALWLIRR